MKSNKWNCAVVFLCVLSMFNIEITRAAVTIRQQDFPASHLIGGDICHEGTLVIIFDGTEEGGRKVVIPIGGTLVTPFPVEVYYGAMTWNLAKTKKVNPSVRFLVKFKKAVRKDPVLLGMFVPKRRKVVLYNPPAFSPWHLQAGTAQLKAILQNAGHQVLQRHGYIIGLEHMLALYGPRDTQVALKTIRAPNSDIIQMYDARMTLEQLSAAIPTKDKFRIERNNVIYQSQYQDGTITGALRAIRDRESNFWYPYFSQVELPVVRDFQPDIYGISIGDERQLFPGLVLASMVKDTLPNTLVVLGGNFCSRVIGSYSHPEFTKLFDHLDAIVYREGHQPILELAANLRPSMASGTVWHDGDKVMVNSGTPDPTDFESLPTPDFNGNARQWSPDVVPSLYTMSNCPMACGFCGISAGSDSYLSNPRFMSSQRIAQHMVATGAHRFDITDEMFSIQRQIALGVELKRIGYPATWQCYLTVSNQLTDPKICEQLYDAGCRAVQLGLESLSKDTLLREYKQWNTPKNYGRILQNLRAAGIQTHVFLIVGIPGEPLHTNLKWLPFIEEYGSGILTIKSGRYRLTRTSPEEMEESHSQWIEVLPDDKPLHLNRDFRYRSISSRKIDGVRDILEQACRNHWAYGVTSTIPWWIHRGRYTWQELHHLATQLPSEPEVRHLPEQIAQMRTIVQQELGQKATFQTFGQLTDYARTLL